MSKPYKGLTVVRWLRSEFHACDLRVRPYVGKTPEEAFELMLTEQLLWDRQWLRARLRRYAGRYLRMTSDKYDDRTMVAGPHSDKLIRKLAFSAFKRWQRSEAAKRARR